MLEREFLSELEQLSVSLRQNIEAFEAGLDDSPAAIKERRRRVLHGDFEFFAYTYFPHHIRGEPSAFQSHFCNRFPQLLSQKQGCREWWVAPRGEAKSSLLTKIGPVYLAVQGLLQRPEVREEVGITTIPEFLDYVVLLGAETKLPTKLLMVVKTELESNTMLRIDFPDVCGPGPVWKVGELVTRTNVKVEPFGAEQATRGTFHGSSRPKVLMPDDIITDKEAKSPTERENRWNWLEAAIDYLGPTDGTVKMCGVGTILNKDDVISRAKHSIGYIVHHFKAIEVFPTNMDLWEQCAAVMLNEDKKHQAQHGDLVINDTDLPSYKFYLKHKKQMDKGAVISWPSVRTLYGLMRQRTKNKKTFDTEMQGDARSDDEKVFINIQFFVSRLKHWIYFGGCDPSMGKNQKSDPSAILVGGWDTENKKLHVVHADSKRRVPSKLLGDLIAVQAEFKCFSIGFENNSAFEHMRGDFMDRALRDYETSLPLHGVTATVDPVIRIESLDHYINDAFNPRILFDPGLLKLLDELDDWPEKQSHHHYDGLTALEILWQIASTRAGGLPRIALGGQRNNTGGRHQHKFRGY
jgi:hypothetical protein